jgi:hypothetical protein
MAYLAPDSSEEAILTGGWRKEEIRYHGRSRNLPHGTDSYLIRQELYHFYSRVREIGLSNR